MKNIRVPKPSQLIDILKNYSPLSSNSQRIEKMLGSAVEGLRDPENGNHFSHLTDLSSLHVLRWIKVKMEESEEGNKILQEKPRINEDTLNFSELKNYDKNSLGYHYYTYMNENMFTPDERPVSKYIPDLDLSYICQRYKETHDFYHVLLGYGRTIPDELAVKWFEALHLRLPSSSFASLFGPLRLSASEMINLYTNYLPHAIFNAEKSKFVMSIYFEKRLKEDINRLRKEVNIVPLNQYNIKH